MTTIVNAPPAETAMTRILGCAPLFPLTLLSLGSLSPPLLAEEEEDDEEEDDDDELRRGRGRGKRV